jgi:hypothetical protein
MLRHGLLFFLAGFGAVAGCTGRDGIRDAGDAARSLVRVEVSYTRVQGAPLNEASFDAQAHFVRYRSFDRAGVPTILGLPDYESIPLESCRVSDGVAQLDEALAGTSLEGDGTARAVPAEVALLDAGRIELRGPVDRAVMRPHHYPELVPFVAGVVYAGDETTPVTLALGQSYQVTGDGGDEVGPFAAAATAPRAFPALSVDTLHRAGGIAGDLEVRWADAGDGVEPILLEVKWSSRGGARAVRCRVRDDGEFAVPHDAFDSLPAQPGAATVSAIRFQRGPLLAPGAGRGDFTLELRDVVPLIVSP